METVYLPLGDPNEAVYFDLDARLVTLACGDRVPVLNYYDADGEEVHDHETDLHDHLAVVCGPVSTGDLLMVTIHLNNGRTKGQSYPAIGEPGTAQAASYRNH